jgi:hypothetical protein
MRHIPVWQNLRDLCPSCHSWRFIAKRSFTAMILLILIGLVSLAAIVGTIVTVVRDGYGRVRTDRTRLPHPPDAAQAGFDASPAMVTAATPASFQVQRGWS